MVVMTDMNPHHLFLGRKNALRARNAGRFSNRKENETRAFCSNERTDIGKQGVELNMPIKLGAVFGIKIR